MLHPPFPEPDASNGYLCEHIALLRRSYRALTGRDLIDPGLDERAAALALFEAPFALLSHDQAPDPVLTYGNRTVMRLFELTWGQLTILPSRYTAQAPDRAARERLLREVGARGYIDDYAGVRVSTSGRRFLIAGACVWNLMDDAGRTWGQAASFADWRLLDTEQESATDGYQ
jgi:hypothetical protein